MTPAELRQKLTDLIATWENEVVEFKEVSHDYDTDKIGRYFSALANEANLRDADAGWPVATLLDRAKVTQRGQVTRTALLLLGRAESAYLLSPHPAQMTWKLVGPETAYEHFGPPFLLATSQLYQRIRNIQLRLLPDDELLPHEVSKYDQKVVLEALHNCIAHQDYRQNQRIIVTERPDRLVLENAGRFFEGAPEDYVRGDKTPRGYRNPYLVQAMVELNMIDQMGYGIQRMYETQRKRYLPMPDYEVAGDAVVMTVYGGVVDPAYTRVLMENGGLQLTDVLALDRVQKGLEVPDGAIQALKRKGLVEGRRPNLRVSAAVAAASSKKAEYIKTRAFDDQHYADLVVQYLSKFGSPLCQGSCPLLYFSSISQVGGIGR